MPNQTEKARRFLALHHGDRPLLLPNPWDVGSARVLEALGFDALATTSSGLAATLGRLDGATTRTEAVDHAAAIAAAVDVPVSADLENGFADEPEGVAETARLAVEAGLAGFSIEDHPADGSSPTYEIGLAAARVAAAVEVAHGGAAPLVVTARAENHLHGVDDLADTIARLQAFQGVGADVLYAPGITAPDDIRRLVGSVDRPVNVLALPGTPTVPELAELGVARVSIGGAFHHVAMAALVSAARELRDDGTYGFWDEAGAREVTRRAFAPRPPATD